MKMGWLLLSYHQLFDGSHNLPETNNKLQIDIVIVITDYLKSDQFESADSSWNEPKADLFREGALRAICIERCQDS
jgi:hypothetical protein